MHANTVTPLLARRVVLLETHFERVAQSRMKGLPVLHPALRVQAVGFAVEAPAAGRSGQGGSLPNCAVGVLITPWFMNLLRLPLPSLAPLQAVQAGWLALGHSGKREVGAHSFEFLGHCEGDAALGDLGVFEACSLFSPMFGFVDHDAAVATAQAVLQQLRVGDEHRVTAPARRGFLFGRSAAAQGGSP